MSIQLNPEYWAIYRETPIGLERYLNDDGKWVFPHAAKERLHGYEMEQPPWLLFGDEGLIIPLCNPVVKEKTELVKQAVDQIDDIRVHHRYIHLFTAVLRTQL